MPLELAAVEESSLPTDVNMCHVFMSSSIKVECFVLFGSSALSGGWGLS
jgi:hypothetical protein